MQPKTVRQNPGSEERSGDPLKLAAIVISVLALLVSGSTLYYTHLRVERTLLATIGSVDVRSVENRPDKVAIRAELFFVSSGNRTAAVFGAGFGVLHAPRPDDPPRLAYRCALTSDSFASGLEALPYIRSDAARLDADGLVVDAFTYGRRRSLPR